MRPRFDIVDCRDSLLTLRRVDGFVIESGVDERLIALMGIRVAHIDGCEKLRRSRTLAFNDFAVAKGVDLQSC